MTIDRAGQTVKEVIEYSEITFNKLVRLKTFPRSSDTDFSAVPFLSWLADTMHVRMVVGKKHGPFD
jgi:hypothetical protein